MHRSIDEAAVREIYSLDHPLGYRSRVRVQDRRTSFWITGSFEAEGSAIGSFTRTLICTDNGLRATHDSIEVHPQFRS